MGGGINAYCACKSFSFSEQKNIYCICIASIFFMADLNLHGIDEQKG